MYQDQLIIHPKCCCLEADDVSSEKCLKRWFRVYDIKTNNHIQLGVCNSYLRILIQTFKQGERNKYNITNYHYTQTLRLLFSKYVYCENPYNIHVGSIYNDLNSRFINFSVCERPYISSSVPILEFMQMYLDSPNWHFYQYLRDVLSEYFKSFPPYKKYKTKYGKSMRMVKKLEYCYDKEELTTIMTDIVLEILNANIKHKN